jgi:hypothetical protein
LAQSVFIFKTLLTTAGCWHATVRRLTRFGLSCTFGEKTIDLRDYKPGAYIVRIWADGKVVESSKFIKL